MSGWGVEEVIPFDEVFLGHLGTREWTKIKVDGKPPIQRLFFDFVKVFDFFIMGYGTADDIGVLHILRCE